MLAKNEERDADKINEVVGDQLYEGLSGLTLEQAKELTQPVLMSPSRKRFRLN